jgi:hypothetical protein
VVGHTVCTNQHATFFASNQLTRLLTAAGRLLLLVRSLILLILALATVVVQEFVLDVGLLFYVLLLIACTWHI